MKKISVSILSSKNLEDDIERINFSNADFIHVDVADGKFVKNKSNPYKIITKMTKNLHKRLDVHLMEANPLQNMNLYAGLNTECITIHVELKEVSKYLELIKKYGIKCGLAINPDTDIMTLKPYLDIIDIIIVMGVNPGYGGQPFIKDTTKKIIKIKKMIVTSGRDIKITVDGGVNEETSKGLDFADILVSGSFVLNSDDISTSCDLLRNNADKLKKKEKREE